MLELHAAFLGLKGFAKDIHDCEILLRIDNTTAVSYKNRLDPTPTFEQYIIDFESIWQ